MKILMVHNSYRFPGGEDRVFLSEADLLRRRGHIVVEHREDNRRIAQLGRGALATTTLWSAASRRKIRRLVSAQNIDVVHFHNTFPLVSPSAYYGSVEAGAAVVQTLHNFRLVCPTATLFRDGAICEDCVGKTYPWPSVVHACYHDSRAATSTIASMLLLHRVLRTWQKQVDAYIALTEFARQKFAASGLPPSRIVVKPNFVYPDPGSSSADGAYALFVGRLSPEKGILSLLEAWRRVRSLPLKIVGSGPLLEEVRAVIQAQDLTHIEVLGQMPAEQVLGFMKATSFLIVPSLWYEGFPLVIAEAFACGKAVIASRLGGMAEIVQDGETGLLSEPGIPEDLAKKVEWFRDHHQEVRNMGTMARRTFEKQYTADVNYQRLLDIYGQAIAAKEIRKIRVPNRAHQARRRKV